MNKVGLVISREYFTRVKKKSFLITTLLVPVVIIGFYAAIIAIAVKGSDDKKSVAVIDNANLFNGRIENDNENLNFTLIPNETEKSFVNKYKGQGYEAFLYIPPINIDSPKNLVIHSQSSVSLSVNSDIEDVVNRAIINKRLAAQGISADQYKKIECLRSVLCLWHSYLHDDDHLWHTGYAWCHGRKNESYC